MPITSSIQDSRRRMDAALHRDINPDMHVRHFCVFGKEASLYYAEGLCSIDFLQHYVLAPLTELRAASAPTDMAAALRQAVYNADVQAAQTVEEAVTQTLTGRAVVFVDGMDSAQGFDVRMFVRRGIAPPLTADIKSRSNSLKSGCL